MFEKDAEEYQIRKHHQRLYGNRPVVMKELNTTYKDGFKDGYNKANEEMKDIIKKLLHKLIMATAPYAFFTKESIDRLVDIWCKNTIALANNEPQNVIARN